MSRIWTSLVGDAENYTLENRAINSICIISLMVLIVLLPFNIYMGLNTVWMIMVAVILLLSFLYYLSKVLKKYKLSVNYYAALSYLLLFSNYFFNSGSKGPSLLLFCLSFQLLIAFTPNKQHIIWVFTHLIATSALLFVEYFYPAKVPFTYSHREDQYIDLWTSIIVVLSCMYCITIYLRSNYNKEKKRTEEHARRIEEQNEQINKQVEQLRALNQQKSKVLSVLSNDLKMPLQSIISYLELLNNYPIPEERSAELKTNLLHTTRNTSNLVSNLFTWSSLQMNSLKIDFEKIDINEMINKVCQSQKIFADAKVITIRLVSVADIAVFADEAFLEICIRNLLNNAIKFTTEGGVVEIRTSEERGQCIISVRDNGVGLSEGQIDTIFSLDIRATFGSNNEKGIGLGLVLCKEFATLHKGKIWASSQPKKGAIFSLSLPIYREDAA